MATAYTEVSSKGVQKYSLQLVFTMNLNLRNRYFVGEHCTTRDLPFLLSHIPIDTMSITKITLVVDMILAELTMVQQCLVWCSRAVVFKVIPSVYRIISRVYNWEIGYEGCTVREMDYSEFWVSLLEFPKYRNLAENAIAVLIQMPTTSVKKGFPVVLKSKLKTMQE